MYKPNYKSYSIIRYSNYWTTGNFTRCLYAEIDLSFTFSNMTSFSTLGMPSTVKKIQPVFYLTSYGEQQNEFYI